MHKLPLLTYKRILILISYVLKEIDTGDNDGEDVSTTLICIL